MKKLILVLIASVSLATANAQSQSWLLYGNVSMTNEPAVQSELNWSFSPGIGYQINDNWTVGINIAWSQVQTGQDASGGGIVMNNYWGGPFVRYTHTISSMFYCFSQLDLSYIGSYRTPGHHPADMKASGFGANLWPAIGINVGKGYGLNFSLGGLGYSAVTPSSDAGQWPAGQTNTTTKFNLSFGQTLMIGLSKNFGGHAHGGHMEPGSELRHQDSDEDK